MQMTIILNEDGEIVDDYSQFYDENKLRKVTYIIGQVLTMLLISVMKVAID